MTRRIDQLLSANELLKFEEIIAQVSKEFPDIIGVLAAGSLVQHYENTFGHFAPHHRTARGFAYEKIRNPGRRRLRVRESSDLDLWICVKDTALSLSARPEVEREAIKLLDELAKKTLIWGTPQWSERKRALLGQHYKKSETYPKGFVNTNGDGEPWLARQFKANLEARVLLELPILARQVNRYFTKKIPGDFFEIRAFPESLFHLRGEKNIMPTMQEDKEPFPRIFDEQWISPSHSCRILFSKADQISIYPFKKDGQILGSKILEELAMGEQLPKLSYGAFVLKPDAIEKGFHDFIMVKIIDALSRINARIVLRKQVLINGQAIERIYPTLSGRPLEEAAGHLVGRVVEVLIVESLLSANELLQAIKNIKGRRLIDRTNERLLEGRILDGSIRDLLPLPADEHTYRSILPTIMARKQDNSIRFTDEAYAFYAQNLVHSADNEDELQGVFSLVDFKRPE
jgi:nucleoside diphosphate kinase